LGERGETVYGSMRMWLVVLDGDEPVSWVEVNRDEFLIGRDDTCTLQLDDPRISRFHARISGGTGPFRLLHDLDSTNGTLLDGRPIRKGVGFTAPDDRVAELHGGELLQFGDTRVLATLKDPSRVLPPEGGPAG
jgi:pSer/pThr/pTyr-binding forkhead associated (FHA) protein